MSRGGAVRDAAIALGAFVVATLLAELLGAANLGTALTFGAIAFMAAIVGTILARARGTAPGRSVASEPETAPATPAAPKRKPPPPPPRKRRR